jgi:DNA-binding MarR family transcriptional regulator
MKRHSQKITHFIDLLSDEEILNLYKHFSGVTQVKFKDRQDAEIRLLTVSYGKLRHQMIAAFKECRLPEATIIQFSQLLRGPIAFPHGQMTDTDLKKHAVALGQGKKQDKEANEARGSRGFSQAAATILLAIREMIPENEPGAVVKDEDWANTTEIAKKLDTSTIAVCKAIEQLVKQKLVTMEDDSPDDKTPLFYVMITQAGRDLEIKPPLARLPNSTTGPRGGFAGKYIFKLVQTNPRREGTHGWNSFNIVTDGMSYEDYKRAGGRNNDLQWDIDHNFLTTGDTADEKPRQPDKGKKEETTTDSGKKGSKGAHPERKEAPAKTAPGTVPDGAGRAVPKGQAGTGSGAGVAPRGKKVLRKRETVRRNGKQHNGAVAGKRKGR